jgi:hypothetical protein
MYWFIIKLFALSLVPLPINPKITRPDPKKLFWTFTCDEFKSAFQISKIFYTESYAAHVLRKSD